MKALKSRSAYSIILGFTLLLSIIGVILGYANSSIDYAVGAVNGTFIVTFLLAAVVLILMLKGSEKAATVGLSVWMSYFVLNHLYELGGTVTDILHMNMGTSANVFAMLTSPLLLPMNISVLGEVAVIILVVILGLLLIKQIVYGKASLKAIRVLSVLAVLASFATIISPIVLIALGANAVTLILYLMVTNLVELTLILLFVVFANDIAKIKE